MIPESNKIKKGKSFKDKFSTILIVVISVGLIGTLLVSNIRMNKKRARYNTQIETLKDQIQNIEKKTAEIRKGVSEAGSDDQLEKVAREQLGLKAPGEEVVIITREDEDESSFTSEVQEKKRNSWSPKTWWSWIRGK